MGFRSILKSQYSRIYLQMQGRLNEKAGNTFNFLKISHYLLPPVLHYRTKFTGRLAVWRISWVLPYIDQNWNLLLIYWQFLYIFNGNLFRIKHHNFEYVCTHAVCTSNSMRASWQQQPPCSLAFHLFTMDSVSNKILMPSSFGEFALLLIKEMPQNKIWNIWLIIYTNFPLGFYFAT